MARNNVTTTLAAGITSGAASLTVPAGKGALFVNGNAQLYSGGLLEVVTITSVVGDTLNITRGADGTTAQAWSTGATVMQGPTAGMWPALVSARFSTFKAGVTLTGPAHATWSPSANLHPLPKSYADTTYYPSTQPFQTAFGFTPVHKWQGTGATGIGWNGNLYAYYNATYLGALYTTANFNPANYAAAGANCNWGSGVVELGQAGTPIGHGISNTVDSGAPWVMEGFRGTSSTSNQNMPYPRVVWLRNQ